MSAAGPQQGSAPFEVGLDFYTLDHFRRLMDELPPLGLGRDAGERIAAGAEFVQRKGREDRFIYGVNTGFGSLCETRVEAEEMEQLQYNHVVSHACGVGEPVGEEIARLTLFIKLLTFRTGHTGITVGTVERLIELWNRGLIPAIPIRGTVGASGDLAPLAHMALPLLGLGAVHRGDELLTGAEVLRELGREPVRLCPKEGLALTNGVQYINAHAIHALLAVHELIRAADVVAALSVQAFSGSRTFYQPLYHGTSHHPERHRVSANLVRLLDGSNHHELPTCNRSQQDPYSFRCLPQVHAAVRQGYGFVRTVVEREVNGVSDNPLFFPEDDEILFGGNLHGASTAMALDTLAIAVSELTSISERRTYQLLSGDRGLPDFLVRKPGLNSGFMIPQYTSAALVNENKVMSTPASVDTIATCQLQEDHVSMGGTSAYKLQRVVDNCEQVLAIELLTAAQAVDLNRDLRLSPLTEPVYRELRNRIPVLDEDRVMADDMAEARHYVREKRREWSQLVD